MKYSEVFNWKFVKKEASLRQQYCERSLSRRSRLFLPGLSEAVVFAHQASYTKFHPSNSMLEYAVSRYLKEKKRHQA